MGADSSINAEDVVVSVRGVGKLYQLFDDPQDRLKHMLLWRFGKTYGRIFWAVRDISFDLHRGEMLAIIGKNGSGKSTLLQMIAGTLNPTEGNIYCGGRVGALLELGSGFNPEYTGRENIQLNASILGISAEELKDKIQSIIDFADIGEFIDQPVKLYSSGMFVRLAFAVTTGLDSDVLLIDEALAVGDVFFRQKCYQRLEELRGRGVSIILVTHSMGDVEQYCGRAILLHHGQELFQGSAPEAVKRYYLVGQEERIALDNLEIQSLASAPASKAVAFETEQMFSPSSDAFFDISHIPQISNGWARCNWIALCDEHGEPCRVFEQGQTAVFFYDFEVLKDIEVPIGGAQLMNDKGIIVHGKTTLENGVPSPARISANSRVRFRQEIVLAIATGEYTFEVGFSTIQQALFQQKDNLSFQELYAATIRICTLVGLGPFTVVLQKKFGTPQLLHHGLANLPGNFQITVFGSE
jgi:lipopolysaccharide transport system ATP-binding protein